MQKARIKLIGPDAKVLDKVCEEIKEISKRTGVDYSGPVPLPVKKLKIPVRKSPCGNGTGTFECWEMRIHKRLVDIEADERTLRQVMRITIPDKVHVEIVLK